MGEMVYSPNTYAGELYQEKVWPALVPAKGLIDRNIVTAVPGLKKRGILRNISQSIEFQDPSCTFTAQASDDIAVGERYLDPVKYEVMREICFDDIRTSWDAMKLKSGSLNDYVPPVDEESALIDHMNKLVGIMNEELYIKGKAGVSKGTATFTAAYPGLIYRLKADANVNKYATGDVGVANITEMALTGITTANPGVVTVASTAKLRTGTKVTIVGANGNQQVGGVSINEQEFTITVLSATTFSLNKQVTGVTPATSGDVVFINETNVIEVLTHVYNTIPETVRMAEDIRLLVPTHIARAYAIAQATVATANGSYFIGKKEMDFLGDMLEEVFYWPANTIAVWAQSNVFIGFDDISDEVNLRITDLSKTTGDDLYRYKLSMKSDVNHLYGAEILLIAPVTTNP